MSLHDNRGAQSGDQTHRDSAGGDIITTNDPGPWLAFIRSYLHDADQQRTKRDDELAAELVAAQSALDRLSEQFDIYQHFVSNRLAVDAARASTTRLLAVAALVVAVVASGIALL